MRTSQLSNSLVPGKPLFFRKDGDLFSLGRGWSDPELDFCWTDGHFAEISFISDVDFSAGYSISVKCAPYRSHTVTGQQVLFFMNGILVAGEYLSLATEIKFAVPRHIESGGALRMLLHIPTAASPHSGNPASTDSRLLGVQVFSIMLSKDREAVIAARDLSKPAGASSRGT